MEKIKKIIIGLAITMAVIGIIVLITAFIGEINVEKLFVGFIFIFAGIAAYVSGISYIDKK